MTRTILSEGNSRLVALICASEKDLGNICNHFYNQFRTPERCSYAVQYQPPQMQMQVYIEKTQPTPKPCRIHAVNGGMALPVVSNNPYLKKSVQRGIYYYDFAVVGNCGDVEFCLDSFLRQQGLREIDKASSYMSEGELSSLMQYWLNDQVYSI